MSLLFGKINRAASFNPTTAFPLDARSYFENYDEAAARALTAKEAGDTTTVYYYGQTICVLDKDKNEAKLYIIQPNGTLKEVGDGASVDLTEITSEINLLKEKDENFTSLISNLTDIVNQKASASEIAALIESAGHLKREIVDIDTITDYMAEPTKASQNIIYMYKSSFTEDGDAYEEYMRFDNGENITFEKIGDTSVDLSGYAKTTDVNSQISDINNNLTALIQTNIDSIQELNTSKANANEVYNKTEIDALLTGKVNISTITSLQDAINLKADKTELVNYYKLSDTEKPSEGYRLITPDESKILNNLALDDEGNVGISGTVSASNVTGLTDYINNWRSEKGIQEGAQINIIEALYNPDGNAYSIENKGITLPYATNELPGLIKLSNEFKLNENNQLEINSIDISKITQSSDVILNCGGAQGHTYS